MSRAIPWTADMDSTLRKMRDCGCSCEEVAAALGMSKNAVVNRCDRLGLVTGARFRRLHMVIAEDEREETPLPSGHPISWGAISSAEWPHLY